MNKITNTLIAILIAIFTFYAIYRNFVPIYLDVLLPLIFAALLSYLLLIYLLCRNFWSSS